MSKERWLDFMRDEMLFARQHPHEGFEYGDGTKARNDIRETLDHLATLESANAALRARVEALLPLAKLGAEFLSHRPPSAMDLRLLQYSNSTDAVGINTLSVRETDIARRGREAISLDPLPERRGEEG